MKPQSARRPAISCRFQGFTLVEVLVALAITGMLVSILISSLYYMFRVQESLRNEVVEREIDLRRKAWFMDALAGCLPAKEKEGTPFTASENEIQCETTAAVSPGQSGSPLRISFQLQKESGDQIKLNYREGEGKPHLLAQWTATDAGFRYFNTKAQEMRRWPKEKEDLEVLPSLIELRIKAADGQWQVWPVATRNSAWIEAPTKFPFGIEPLR